MNSELLSYLFKEQNPLIELNSFDKNLNLSLIEFYINLQFPLIKFDNSLDFWDNRLLLNTSSSNVNTSVGTGTRTGYNNVVGIEGIEERTEEEVELNWIKWESFSLNLINLNFIKQVRKTLKDYERKDSNELRINKNEFKFPPYLIDEFILSRTIQSKPPFLLPQEQSTASSHSLIQNWSETLKSLLVGNQDEMEDDSLMLELFDLPEIDIALELKLVIPKEAMQELKSLMSRNKSSHSKFLSPIEDEDEDEEEERIFHSPLSSPPRIGSPPIFPRRSSTSSQSQSLFGFEPTPTSTTTPTRNEFLVKDHFFDVTTQQNQNRVRNQSTEQFFSPSGKEIIKMKEWNKLEFIKPFPSSTTTSSPSSPPILPLNNTASNDSTSPFNPTNTTTLNLNSNNLPHSTTKEVQMSIWSSQTTLKDLSSPTTEDYGIEIPILARTNEFDMDFRIKDEPVVDELGLQIRTLIQQQQQEEEISDNEDESGHELEPEEVEEEEDEVDELDPTPTPTPIQTTHSISNELTKLLDEEEEGEGIPMEVESSPNFGLGLEEDGSREDEGVEDILMKSYLKIPTLPLPLFESSPPPLEIINLLFSCRNLPSNRALSLELSWEPFRLSNTNDNQSIYDLILGDSSTENQGAERGGEREEEEEVERFKEGLEKVVEEVEDEFLVGRMEDEGEEQEEGLIARVGKEGIDLELHFTESLVINQEEEQAEEDIPQVAESKLNFSPKPDVTQFVESAPTPTPTPISLPDSSAFVDVISTQFNLDLSPVRYLVELDLEVEVLDEVGSGGNQFHEMKSPKDKEDVIEVIYINSDSESPEEEEDEKEEEKEEMEMAMHDDENNNDNKEETKSVQILDQISLVLPPSSPSPSSSSSLDLPPDKPLDVNLNFMNQELIIPTSLQYLKSETKVEVEVEVEVGAQSMDIQPQISAHQFKRFNPLDQFLNSKGIHLAYSSDTTSSSTKQRTINRKPSNSNLNCISATRPSNTTTNRVQPFQSQFVPLVRPKLPFPLPNYLISTSSPSSSENDKPEKEVAKKRNYRILISNEFLNMRDHYISFSSYGFNLIDRDFLVLFETLKDRNRVEVERGGGRFGAEGGGAGGGGGGEKKGMKSMRGPHLILNEETCVVFFRLIKLVGNVYREFELSEFLPQLTQHQVDDEDEELSGGGKFFTSTASTSREGKRDEAIFTTIFRMSKKFKKVLCIFEEFSEGDSIVLNQTGGRGEGGERGGGNQNERGRRNFSYTKPVLEALELLNRTVLKYFPATSTSTSTTGSGRAGDETGKGKVDIVIVREIDDASKVVKKCLKNLLELEVESSSFGEGGEKKFDERLWLTDDPTIEEIQLLELLPDSLNLNPFSACSLLASKDRNLVIQFVNLDQQDRNFILQKFEEEEERNNGIASEMGLTNLLEIIETFLRFKYQQSLTSPSPSTSSPFLNSLLFQSSSPLNDEQLQPQHQHFSNQTDPKPFHILENEFLDESCDYRGGAQEEEQGGLTDFFDFEVYDLDLN